jgi:tetratricopeptide (TPR) repeat protein
MQARGDAPSIRGSVHTPAGAPVIGLRIRLDSLARGVVGVTATNGSGEFSFFNLPVGSYVLLINELDLQPIRRPVEVGGPPVLGLDLVLEPRNRKSAPPNSATVSVRQLLIPEKARKEYRQGRKAVARGRTAEAIRHWEKAIEIFPNFLESFLQLAKSFADQGDFPRALGASQRAIEIDARNADAYNSLGYVYLKKQEASQAREAFEKAIQLSEPNWFAHLELGRTLLQQKQPLPAYTHLLRARQLQPKLPSVYLLLYNDLLLLDRRKEALAQLEEFLGRFPRDPRVPKIRQVREALARSLASSTASLQQ